MGKPQIEIPLTLTQGGKEYTCLLSLVTGGGSEKGLWHLAVWKKWPKPGWYHIGQLFYAQAHNEWQFHEQSPFFGDITETLVEYLIAWRDGEKS